MASNAKNQKVLLRIRNVKQYFPLKSNKKLFVKANDGISLDIYEGETLGLVGESGCGKSTLGRVILQLYRQTAGDTLYYGKELYDMAPVYVKDTLKSMRESDLKALLAANHDLAGSEAADARKLLHIVQLVGGLVLTDDKAGVEEAYTRLYAAAAERRALRSELAALKLAAEERQAPESAKISDTQKAIAVKDAEFGKIQAEIAKLREGCRNKPGFEKYEEHRDGAVDLARLKYNEMRELRSDVQLIFQDPYSSLNPRMTVGQIVGEALMAHGVFKSESERYTEFVKNVMEECGLAPYMIHRYPHQFSGGQRQRIGIARSLAVRPRFVVCDEAVSALDVSIQSQILNLLQDLKEKENLTYMFISHDLSVVKYISNRIGVMYLGNIVELAETQELFENPLHPYTEALLSAIPTTDAGHKRDEYLLEGDIPSPINPPKGCKFHTRCRYATDICKKDAPEFAEIKEGHFVACHLRTAGE